MGRKKKNQEEVEEKKRAPSPKKEEKRDYDSDDDDTSSEPDLNRQRQQHDIDPEIQQLAYQFRIDANLTQELNDIMIEEREKTWEQDIARLYEILKDAHTPSAMLRMKMKDMEKGKFVGKAKCGERVKELCKKHRLDKGASTKLEEAMSMREAMGKDCMKDLEMLDDHLAASNAPSKLISMKLETLRKGFNVGHCVYSREVAAGASGPGVDGVFNKRGPRSLGYSDADLDKRFNESSMSTGGQLMDEATIKKMMQAEKKKHLAEREKEQTKKEKTKDKKDRGRSSPTPLRGSKGDKKRSRSRSRKRGRSASRSRRKRSSPSVARDRKKKSRSRSAKRKKSPSKSRRSRSRKRTKDKSGSPKRDRDRSRRR